MRPWVPACVAAIAWSGCGGAPVNVSLPDPVPPRPRPAPTRPPAGRPEVPPKDDRAFGGNLTVRVALHWTRGSVEIRSSKGLSVTDVESRRDPKRVSDGRTVKISSAGKRGGVRAYRSGGGTLAAGARSVEFDPIGGGHLIVDGSAVRGRLVVSSRSDSLFVVNEIPLEDYLRGVVPKEIGSRPPEDAPAVEAQAIAARTYTVKRLNQYESLPFDLFGDVMDQVYAGIDGEHSVADAAIRATRGLVLSDGQALLETFYSSTCGGFRSDIRTVWSWRPSHRSLFGGPDGAEGREWCRESRHFRWEESWNGSELSRMFRKHAPALLGLPAGSIRGALTDVRVRGQGPSGRASAIEWTTSHGSWTIQGDRNRWILRRPAGGILRSVFVNLDVTRRGGRVSSVRVTGRGNGHGVGMCQVGALGRAKAGQTARQILEAYYPGARIRAIRGSDLPPGRPGAS